MQNAGCLLDKPECLLRRAASYPLSKHCIGRRGLVWEGLKLSGVSSKMVQQPTEPGGRTILWHWEGKGGEKSSAFINSFQGQKQSWAQVPMQPQPPFSEGPVQTAGRPGKDGAPLSLGTSVMDAEMSHQGQGSQQQPRGQAPTSTGSFILEKSLIKCNQFLCMGGGGRQRHVSQNSGCKQIHKHLQTEKPFPIPIASQF